MGGGAVAGDDEEGDDDMQGDPHAHIAGDGEGLVVDVTETELEAIKRLCDITGCSQERAAEVYLGCGKNEELSANILLEGDDEDEDAALNRALAASTGAGSTSQAQPA